MKSLEHHLGGKTSLGIVSPQFDDCWLLTFFLDVERTYQIISTTISMISHHKDALLEACFEEPHDIFQVFC